jgi:hypothetical protein
MRTTIQLEDKLLQDVKAFAAETGKSVSAVIEEALRRALAQRRPTAPNGRVRLKTHGRGGLQPGVNLDNTAALLDLMDSPNEAS